MSRVFPVLAWLTILLTLAVLIGLAYLYLFDGNPPAVLTVPYHTEKGQYSRGENLTFLAHVCKTRQYPVVAYPILVEVPDTPSYPPVEGKYYQLPAVQTPGSPSGCGDYHIKGFFTIPQDLPLGKYYLKGTSVYQVNFLVTRSLPWYTNTFQVQ